MIRSLEPPHIKTIRRHSKFMDIQRIVLFAGLAIVSYLMVLAWNEDYHLPQTTPVAAEHSSAPSAVIDGVDKQETTAQETAAAGEEEFITPEGNDPATLTGTAETPSIPVSDHLITLKTDVIELQIDPVGGNLVEASLLDYDDSLGSEQPLKILQNNAQRTFLLESGLIGKNGFDSRRNGTPPVYQTAKSNYELGNGETELMVDLVFTSDNGVKVTKRYSIARNSYEIKVDYLIDNQSDAVWEGNFSGKIVRDQSPDPTAQNSLGIKAFLGLVISTPDKPYEKFNFKDLASKPINQTVTNGWLAFLQHYFLTAWIPAEDQANQYQTTRRGNLEIMGFVSPATIVAPGEIGEVSARAYIGPKIIDQLETVAPNLDRTVDFGFLFFIALPLYIVLNWFQSIVGNWGVAIILLTVLVKAVFFHLSATSYRSMGRMRAVAPQLARLRELYGDDRQRMSQEMMTLYKREKINPLGGCLPILVQMPVFISLYWVLFESVQLRHAPFMLWIHDLSVMDPYFILPILMGTSMFIQMSLNPTPPDPMQAKIMKLMPVVFTVFFLWFPAGLVLYWLVNNILSISQQWYITRKIEIEMASKKS